MPRRQKIENGFPMGYYAVFTPSRAQKGNKDRDREA